MAELLRQYIFKLLTAGLCKNVKADADIEKVKSEVMTMNKKELLNFLA